MQPSFYAVIPASVRYCESLEPSAKLLFGEITALCNQTGECFARNEYFANLYKVDERTIRRWKKSLADNSFILDAGNGSVFLIAESRTKMSNEDKNVQIQDKNVQTTGQKCPNALYSINNTSYYSSSYSEQEEKEEEQKIEKLKGEKCFTIEEVENRIRVQNIMDDFWYKLGSVDDLRNSIAEMLYHYAEKGKTIPATLAESRLRSWLKPKHETEEERDQLKKSVLRAKKRAEISRTINDTQTTEKNDSGRKEFDFMAIPEQKRNEYLEKAKNEIMNNARFRNSGLSQNALNGIIKSKAVSMAKNELLTESC